MDRILSPGHCYTSGHIHSLTVCHAFGRGSGWQVVPPVPLLAGAVFMYGALRGLLPTLRRTQSEGRDWFYADNGYFKPGHYRGFYRITRNRYQHDGGGATDGKRWRALGIPIEPWRKNGRHILICPPSQAFGDWYGLNAADWLSVTVREIRSLTDRPIIVREKSASGIRQLSLDLIDCHALVTHSSAAAVHAVLAGVPIHCTADCAASRMTFRDLADIESPPQFVHEFREHWAGVLADNQWTLAEMREGLAWRTLTERSSRSIAV